MNYSIQSSWLPWFMSQIEATDSGCWLWVGTKTRAGYGSPRIEGKHRRAHRVVYEMIVGPIPEGLSVLHKCDVRNCCNPDHLYVGTQADNMRDMQLRGRNGHYTHPEATPRGRRHGHYTHPESYRGERNGKAKLTEDQVRITRMAAKQGITQRTLAQHFGVSQPTIYSIIHRKTWTYLDSDLSPLLDAEKESAPGE